MARIWLHSEIESLIVEYKEGLSLDFLCSKYGRTPSSLMTILSDKGIHRHRLPIQDDVLVSRYKDGESCLKLAKEFGCDIGTVLNRIRGKIDIRPDSCMTNVKYKVDEEFFDKIDTEKKAYILGLIYADGCVVHNTVSISLIHTDRELLEDVKVAMGSDAVIQEVPARGKDKPQVRLAINRKTITDRLRQIGCHERKSLNLMFPMFLTDDLLPHFIRGYFDGDGGISGSVRKTDYDISFCGTMEFLNSLQDVLIDKLGIRKRRLRRKKSVHVNSYSVRYTGRIQVEYMMDWLYKDSSISLLRKREKYVSLRESIRDGTKYLHKRVTPLNLLRSSK